MRNLVVTRVIVLFSLAVLAVACASAPPLTDAGAQTRAITADQAKNCKFLRIVQYSDRIMSMGKEHTVMRAIGETNLRNKIGATGGNAFVLVKSEINSFLGTVAYEAQAYKCPE